MSPSSLVSQSRVYFLPERVGGGLRSIWVPKISINHRINQLAYRKKEMGNRDFKLHESRDSIS